MPNAQRHLYEFGPYRIDSVERLLLRGGETIPLTPKALDTLLALLASPGRVVERDELIKTVWPDTFVEDGALARNISALRKALGEGSEDSRYIETIPKRGYRFTAPVKDVAELPPAPPPAPARADRRKMLRRFAWIIPAAGLIQLAWAYPRLVRQSSAGPVNIRSLAGLPRDNSSND